ncbi:thyrotropin-releasing hormone receptor-like [Lineus longissimus]|uniref:thyrotropin-releasing hormone receptor-like n=1 Tax=Lineus longissimus TaxID=88925 RepID=UPI002B4D245C
MDEVTTLHSLTKPEDLSYFFYIQTVPIAIGIPGNILAIIVANRKNNKQLSPSIYITAMGVADTVLLLERIGSILVNTVFFELDLIAEPAWWFRVTLYVLYTSSILSGLFLAGMSVDRLIAVRFPMDAQRLCTTSRARKLVFGLTVFISLVNLHLFYVVRYFKDKELGIYAVLIEAPEYKVVELLVSSFHMVVGTILPFLIIFICNIIIIVTLRNAANDRRIFENNPKKNSGSQHLTRMLIFVSFAYIIITLPYRLYHLLMRIPGVGYDLSVLYWRRRYITEAWTFLAIWLFNYSVNFYLYCLGGGRKYRDDAKQVLKGKFCS